MAKVKVTVKFQILELIDSFIDSTTANSIGETVVDEATRMISEGQSPVRGYGRFDGYSDSYKAAIKGDVNTRVSAARQIVQTKYGTKASPRKTKARTKAVNAAKEAGKKVRPVNLTVTGKMLALFGYRIKGDVIEVGFVRSGEHAELAQIHNDGTDKIPQRKMVPGEGEEWSITIMRAIRDAYGTRLEKIIRQSNKSV